MSIDPHEQRSVPEEMALFPEMNPGPVIRTDLDGRILLVNTAAQRLFGRDDLVGQHWPTVCPDVDPVVWAEALAGRDMLQHESALDRGHFAFTYRRPAGFPSVFIYGNDITKRREDEALLAEQQRRLAEMAEFPNMNPWPVLRLDRAGAIILVNSAARDVLGASAAQGRSWKTLCLALTDEIWDRILSSTDVVPLEASLGGRQYVFAHRRTTKGDLVFVFGSDVTLLRSTEEALRQSEKMATLGTLAAGVAHELNNPAAAAARGASQLREAFAALQDAFVRMSLLQLTPARVARLLDILRDDRDRLARAAMVDPLTRSDLEADVEEWLEDHQVEAAGPIADALVSLGYDVAELDLLASEWGEDLSAVVHWIGRAQPALALSREIEEATRRISEIVKALKSYSYIGQAPVQMVDVTEGLESTLVMLRAKLRNIRLRKEFESGLPAIQAHGSELNQVWTNLLDNAAQALDGSGTIALRARRDGDHVVVDIEDDGPGIPPPLQDRIFDPFFTTKEPGKGTGLGLSTSRNIIEKKHGGTIAVASRPGQTTFTVRLPARATGAPAGH